MPWKTNEEGQLVIDAGNPVFAHPDGREEPFNADAAMLKIKELTAEAARHRTKYNEAKQLAKPIQDAGIQNVTEYLEKASEALSLVDSYKNKKTPTAEEIERIKQNVAATFEARMTDKEKQHQKTLQQLSDEVQQKNNLLREQIVKGYFNQSDFLKERTHLLPDFAYASFGKHFVVEEKDGRLEKYAVDAKGEKIFSLKGSSYASPEEAIEILVKSHPQRDKLLKAGGGGSGASGGATKTPFTGRTIERGDAAAASRNLEKIASGEVVVA